MFRYQPHNFLGMTRVCDLNTYERTSECVSEIFTWFLFKAILCTLGSLPNKRKKVQNKNHKIKSCEHIHIQKKKIH